MRDARLAVTVVGVAVAAGAPARSRLSRYPTRTAPAGPGHVHTCLQAASGGHKPSLGRRGATAAQWCGCGGRPRRPARRTDRRARRR
jgi:hypothetical protein